MNRVWTAFGAPVGALLLLLGSLATNAVAVDAESTRKTNSKRGLLRVTATDSDSARALPVRVRVVRAALLAKDRVFHEASGRLELPLDPGDYRVVVTHGPAYSIFDQRVTIERGRTRNVDAALQREVDFSAYTGCDLHLHTDASPDSNLSVAERVATMLAEDLSLGVITDHNRITEVTDAERAGLSFLPGVEVTTWDPEFGHFNAFPVTRPPPYKRTSEHELLRALRASADTFVQINHPRLETHIGYFELRGFDRERPDAHGHAAFDGIEVWNGYELAAPSARHAVFLDWLAWNARGRRTVATGGSDSHKRDRAPHAGYPRTYVRIAAAAANRSQRAFVALKRGAAFVSNGPLLELMVEGAHPGEVLAVRAGARSVHATVHVAAPVWMELSDVEIWLGTERVRRVSLERARWQTSSSVHLELELPVSSARTIVATVSGAGSMEPLLGERRSRPYAFTNPVWLERR